MYGPHLYPNSNKLENTHIFDTSEITGNLNTGLNIYWYQGIIVVFKMWYNILWSCFLKSYLLVIHTELFTYKIDDFWDLFQNNTGMGEIR